MIMCKMDNTTVSEEPMKLLSPVPPESVEHAKKIIYKLVEHM